MLEQGLYFPAHSVEVSYLPGWLLQIGHQANQRLFSILFSVFQHNEVQQHPFQKKGFVEYLAGHLAVFDLTSQALVASAFRLVYGLSVCPAFEPYYEIYRCGEPSHCLEGT